MRSIAQNHQILVNNVWFKISQSFLMSVTESEDFDCRPEFKSWRVEATLLPVFLMGESSRVELQCHGRHGIVGTLRLGTQSSICQ